MTTGSGKKTPRKPKSGKSAASRSQRKKVVDKTPDSVAIDKDKMAAFFSAAGIESKEAGEAKVAKEAAVKKAEDKVSVATMVESVKPVAVEAETVAADPVIEDEPVATEPGSDPLNNTDTLNDNNEKNGEPLVKTIPKASGNGSGSDSFNILYMFFVLVVLALFWFYFISSSPQQTGAEVQIEQGKTQILTLTTKNKALEIENSKLKSKLEQLEKVSHKEEKAAEKSIVPVSAGPVSPNKPVAEAPEDPAPVSEIKQESSFDKAPIPFWRNMGPRGSLIKKAPAKVKPAVKIPAAKVDSFSRAPKPFWLTPRVKPAAAKVEKKSVIAAPPAVKCPCKYRKSSALQTPALDPSFQKAPKPFWIKN